MKKLLLVIAVTGILAAQTGIDVGQLRARSAGKILLVGDGFFNIIPAQLGPGLTIDWSTSPPTLNAKASGTVATEREIYRPTVPTADFTIPQAFVPSSVRLYSNGLLLAPGDEASGADYQINGSMVHFHPASVPQAGWTVQLLYAPSG